MTKPDSVFISYAHIDNEVLGAGQEGWISVFHKALEVRISQLLGRRPNIWRDPKLQGNDYFGDEIVNQFSGLAVFIAILSPRYLTSEWCLRELETFHKTASAANTLRVGNKGRIFKVIKTQVPFDRHPPEIVDLLGYEFFKVDPATGRARELSQTAGPDLERLYWGKLDDIAYDVSDLLDSLKICEKSNPTTSQRANEPDSGKTVYLAHTSFDLKDEWNAVKRDLQQSGVAVLPEKGPALEAHEFMDLVNTDLSKARISVHMIGRNYGFIPEGAENSIIALQNELALKRQTESGFQRIIWLPPNLEIQDKRQQQFRHYLETDDSVQLGAELLEAPLEDVKELIHQKLEPKQQPDPEPEPLEGEAETTSIYLICDPLDLDAVEPLDDYLYDQGFEVILPVFEGEEDQVRLDHQESLKTCHSLIIYFGQASELWLRAKMRELQKIAGYGRTKALLAKAIYIGGPAHRKKDRLRSRDALVLKGQEGFHPNQLAPFLEQLRKKQ